MNRRLIRQTKPAQAVLILTISLGVLAGGVTTAQAFFLSRVINRVFLEGQTLGQVSTLLLFFGGLSLVRAACVWVSQVTAQRIAGVVKNDLRRQLTAHLLALGPAYTQGERSGELAATVVEGVESLDAYFSQYLPQLAMAVLIPSITLAVVFPLDITSGLVLLLTAPLIPLFMVLIGSHTQTLTQRRWTILSRMSAHFLDVLQGLPTLKLLGRSREQIKVIALISDRFRKTTMEVLRFAFLSALTLELLATLSTAIVAVEVGLRLLYGRLEFEQAFFVLILAPEFYLPLRQLGSRFHAATSGVTAAKRIFEVLELPVHETGRQVGGGLDLLQDLPPKGGRNTNSLHWQASSLSENPCSVGPCSQARRSRGVKPPLRQPARETSCENFPIPPNLRHNPPTICFDDVYYSYDSGRRPALQGVSFSLVPGQKVALVGPSGAGKSTIAQLLLRFIEPTRGHITVDGRPLNELDSTVWRAGLTWVPQHPYFFYASVADNIRLACPEAGLAEIIEAAHQAHAETFIEELPQGYDTLIGERGARLSGGQAQRIALARALLKDAPLFIFDEATANLDAEHESQIQAALERSMVGRTALIIAHRLNTITKADKILVLNGGQIVASGDHQTLSGQPGLYQRLLVAYKGAGR